MLRLEINLCKNKNMTPRYFAMVAITMGSLFLGIAFDALPQERSISVSFNNTSINTLHCYMLKDGGYVPFLILEEKHEKRFDAFLADSKVGCQIKIDNRSSTMLTHFTVKIPGVYDFLLEQVPCPSCQGREWRWATIVVDPNGQPDYLRLASESGPSTPVPKDSIPLPGGVLSDSCKSVLSNCAKYQCVNVRTSDASTCRGACLAQLVKTMSAAGVSVSEGMGGDLHDPSACIGIRTDLGGTPTGGECLAKLLGTPYVVGNCIVDGFRYNLRVR